MSAYTKKISLVISIIFLTGAILLFIFLYTKIQTHNKTAQEVELAWQTENNQRQEINSLDSSLKSIEKEKIQLESHFAQSSDIVPFLDTIEKLGVDADTQSEVSSVDILKDNGGLLVGLKTVGSFSAVYKFIVLLENSPYELEFVSMDIQKEITGDTTSDSAVVSNWRGVFRVKLLSFIP